jgi:hypothetical protein
LRALRTALKALPSEPFVTDDKRAQENKRLTRMERRVEKSISLSHLDIGQLDHLRDRVSAGLRPWGGVGDVFKYIDHFRRGRGWDGP